MTTRPPFQRRHLPSTVILAAVGTVVGLVLGGLALFMVEVGWMLVVLFLPVFVIMLVGQALIEGLIYGAIALFRRLRGRPAAAPSPAPETPADPEPLARAYAFQAGLGAALLYTIYVALIQGPTGGGT